jgi:hypothetical protein
MRTVTIHRTRFMNVADGEYVDPRTDSEVIPCEPECEEETAVELAVKVIRDNGLTQASSSAWGPRVWYTDPDGSQIVSYRTGEREAASARLAGFTDAESFAVWTAVAK